MQTSKDIKTMLSLADYYLHSPQFLSLRGRTQKDYEYVISKVMATPIRHGKNMGELKVDRVTVSDCKTAYQQWLARGVRTANMSATLSSLLFNLAEEFELISRNPMRSIKKLQTQPRKVMWTADQVRLFCDTAYAEYKWRSIGLIVQMAYTFAQRIGDMRSLKWDSINFEERRLDLEQSKKRAEVHLPIHINMFRMLEQQHKDFGFQDFVAPHPFPRNGGYVMYNDKEISYLVNQVKDKARLPKELTAMDMRRTAITEMVEAGVDTTQIMAVSGHNSPNSMRLPLKHTFKSASNALDRRESYKDA
jgi:integrase